MSLQPADDGLRIGPEVMPVSSVTLSDGHGRENAQVALIRLPPPGHVRVCAVGRVLR